MRKTFLLSFIIICISFFYEGTNTVQAQSSYIDLTLVESTNYNKPLATFSRESFENAFRVASEDGDLFDPDINNALVLFLNLLLPEHSYIIQHEPTYYFVFQFNKKVGNYLVMNNSIGEKNEAIYKPDFESARNEMLKLLQTFYSSMPVFTIQEYR